MLVQLLAAEALMKKHIDRAKVELGKGGRKQLSGTDQHSRCFFSCTFGVDEVFSMNLSYNVHLECYKTRLVTSSRPLFFGSGDWERRNKLKALARGRGLGWPTWPSLEVYEGIYLMISRSWKEAGCGIAWWNLMENKAEVWFPKTEARMVNFCMIMLMIIIIQRCYLETSCDSSVFFCWTFCVLPKSQAETAQGFATAGGWSEAAKLFLNVMPTFTATELVEFKEPEMRGFLCISWIVFWYLIYSKL